MRGINAFNASSLQREDSTLPTLHPCNDRIQRFRRFKLAKREFNASNTSSLQREDSTLPKLHPCNERIQCTILARMSSLKSSQIHPLGRSRRRPFRVFLPDFEIHCTLTKVASVHCHHDSEHGRLRRLPDFRRVRFPLNSTRIGTNTMKCNQCVPFICAPLVEQPRPPKASSQMSEYKYMWNPPV